MQYTEEQFLTEQKLADDLGFQQNKMHIPFTVAACVCNGIGASWFPEKLRDFVSKMNPSLVVVANNHDLGYYYGSGTHGDFLRINDAFRVNGEKVAKNKYAWYDPRRYWVMLQAAKFAALCDAAGWPAYVAAIKDRQLADGCDETV